MENSSLLPSFSSIPDEIVVNCLARIPRSHYPRLSLVSKTFRSILSSPELYAVRSQLGNTEECLYLCLSDSKSGQLPKWYTLWVNPNQTLTRRKKKKPIGALLVPIPYSSIPCVSKFTILVGFEIYVFDKDGNTEPSSDVRVLDCRSNTWRDAPSMNVARKNASFCLYDGKIYVMGGVKHDKKLSFAEVFDIKTQTWERLPDPGAKIRNCFILEIAEMQGKIYIGNLQKMYGYDTRRGRWVRSDGLIASIVGSGFVIENVSYSLTGLRGCIWYDIKDRKWKDVKGLDSVDKKYRNYQGSSIHTSFRLVSFGGKLLTIWEEYKKKKKIWCAEISVEKRHGGEVWGNVEWLDVLHTASGSCKLLHCLTVSV